MSRIKSAFKKAAEEKRAALIMYLTAGYPSKEAFFGLLETLAEAGVDLIEIGVPFSDPLADGATIQQASQQALEDGVDLDWIFKEAALFRKKFKTPLVLMTYLNPISGYGYARLLAQMKKSGLDGVIIPDLPPDEAGEWLAAACNKTDTIFLVPPTANERRIRLAAARSGGFIYCVSLTGVTGERKELPLGLKDLVGRVKGVSDLPVAVGFGISTPGQVRELSGFSDGVIIGSALIGLLKKHLEPGARKSAVRQYVGSLREALRR